MILRFLLLAVLAGAAASLAGQGVELTSEQPIQYDDRTKEVLALGGARLVYGDYVLTAGEIRYNQETGVAVARGGITLTRGDLRLVAAEGDYRLADGQLRLHNVRTGLFPVQLSGESLVGNVREFTFTAARLTYGEPGAFAPQIVAPEVTVRPGEGYTARRARLQVGRMPVFYLPQFRASLGEPLFDPSVRVGYRSNLGPYLNVTGLAPVSPGIELGAGVGYFGQRGVLLGPAARYRTESREHRAEGSLRSGYIDDHGDKGIDLRGRPIDEDRGFAEWRHRQSWGDRVFLTGQLNAWSDSEVLRDFDRGAFADLQQPDSFLEGAWRAGDHVLVSAFVRAAPHDFQPVVERLPEIRADLLPAPLPGGWLQRGSAGWVRLREDAVRTGLARRSDRLDAHYELSRPWAATPWLTLTPVAGARLTRYSDALGGGSYTRTLGEIGFDARARAYRESNYQNEAWDIDGLRHLVETFLQYRAVPRADRGRGRVPVLDREVFATRLAPLGLGDVRTLDDLRPTNVLRAGLDQRWQTRDGAGGARDLAALVLAVDTRWDRLDREDRLSDVHADLALAPASWLRFEAYARFGIQDPALRELNTALVIEDARFWSLRLGTHFLKSDLEEYDLEALARLNERFSLRGRWRYDARTNSVYEQTYGLRQSFRGLWALEYQVSFYERVQRESSFHFRVLVDVLAF